MRQPETQVPIAGYADHKATSYASDWAGKKKQPPGKELAISQTPVWPTDYYITTRPFHLDKRKHPKGGKKRHIGVDIENPKGGVVYAVLDGIVTKTDQGPAAGNYIFIKHGNGYVTSYSHTSPIVVENDPVARGQVIGFSDGSGNVKPHLHFVLRINGSLIDPKDFLDRAEKPKIKKLPPIDYQAEVRATSQV